MQNMIKYLVASVIVLLTHPGVCGQALEEIKYHLIDLGTLGFGRLGATGINNKGEIIGWYSTVQGPLRTFLYTRGVIKDLFPSFPQGSFAWSINDAGDVVGYRNNPNTPVMNAFLFSEGNMQHFDSFTAVIHQNLDINNLGQIVGTYVPQEISYPRGFIYQNGTVKNLGTLGGNSSSANAINDRGQVVGNASLDPQTYHAFLYGNNRMQDLGTLGGDTSNAYGINNVSQVVGESQITGNSAKHAFLYANGHMQDLGTLGGNGSTAQAISDIGEVIGLSQVPGNDISHAFIYRAGVMKDLNDLLVAPHPDLYIYEATGINNRGQIVGRGITSSGQLRAILLNPLNYAQTISAIEVQPVQPVYGNLVRQPGKTNLIFVTHGAIPPTMVAEDSVAWVSEMTNLISNYLITNNLLDWQVVGYKWVDKAKYNYNPLRRGPEGSLDRGKDEGEVLGAQISTQGWSHIHLIAHSAGAGLIQAIVDLVASNPDNTTTLHATFLDPFLGFLKSGKSKYGSGAQWADQCFTHDSLPFTQGVIEHAFNADVTLLDTNRIEVNGWTSGSEEEGPVCTKVKSSHSWPIEFYKRSLFSNLHTNYNGFGFPLSKEAGGWDYAQAHYTRGGLTNLGGPDLECSLTSNEELVYTNLVKVGETPHVVSETGQIKLSANGFTGLSGSPAWIAMYLNQSNDVNFVAFDAQFLSETGSQGLLNVYWDTNVIGVIDEQVVKSEMRHYSFPFPRTITDLSYVLGFRIDPFTSTQSVILITNISVGLFGTAQTFNINQTTNMNNGLRVWELVGESGFEYTVEASTNLTDWYTISVLLNTTGRVRFADPGSTNSAQRFYRAVILD